MIKCPTIKYLKIIKKQLYSCFLMCVYPLHLSDKFDEVCDIFKLAVN